MPTLEGTIQRLALNQSARSGMTDVLSLEKVELWRGTTARFECALFKGTPSATTLVNSVGNIVSIDLIIRRRNAQGPVIITSTLDSTDVDLSLTWSDWIAALDEHFVFELSSEQTNQVIPNSGTLPIYYSIYVTTATHKYLAGFGYGDIIESGLMDPDTLPPPPILPPYELTIPLIGTSATFSGTVSGAIGIFGALSGGIGAGGLTGLDYWDVEWSGVDTTGATDTTTEFETARAEAVAANVPLLTRGIIQLSENQLVTGQEHWISDTGTTEAGNTGTRFVWTGVAGDTMVTFSNTFRGGFSRITFDGNGLAESCFENSGGKFGTFDDLYCLNWTTGDGVRLIGNATQNCQNNTFRKLSLSCPDDCNSGLYLTSTGEFGNACINDFNHLSVAHRDGVAVLIGAADTNFLQSTHITRHPLGTAYGVLIFNEFPPERGNNQFYGIDPGAGGMRQEGFTTNPQNIVFGYSYGNSAPAPSFSGVGFAYTDSYGNLITPGVVSSSQVWTDLVLAKSVHVQSASTSTIEGFSILSHNLGVGNDFLSINFALGDETAPGTILGFSWEKTAAWQAYGVDRVIFNTPNTNAPWIFAIANDIKMTIALTKITLTQGLELAQISDAGALPGSTYISTTTGKPTYKDPSGGTHVFY